MSSVPNDIELDIDPDVFTTCYWKIEGIKTRFRVIKGGTGAGKSFSVAQDEVLKACESYQKVLVIRKVASTLKNSIYQSILDRCSEFGIDAFVDTTLKPMEIHIGRVGSMFIFLGMDDPEKIKSIEGITRIVVEEATELDYEDFKELNRRLRGVANPQMTLVFNPIDEDHWIKKHFYDSNLANCTLITVTHWDNEFLYKEDHEQIEEMKHFDENQYKIYALAEWGRLKTGSEFLPHFSYVRHTGKASYIKGKPIHISLDFNARPYQPMVCAQIIEGVARWRNPRTKMRFKEQREGTVLERVTQVRFFKEYTGVAGQYPENTVVSVCEAFREDYMGKGSDIFYYGDASGKYNIAGKGDATNFKDVQTTLKKMLNSGSERVPKANPSVMKARDFINRILADKYDIEIIIDDENAPLLAKDLSTILLGKDGVHKEWETDKAGIKFQKNSHLHDAFKYFIIWIFKDLFKNGEYRQTA